MSGTLVFSHGLEGDPWGAKIVAMAEVARAHGLSVESIDYRGMNDPAARVVRMLEACKSLPGKLVLVGSSLGAHVCMTAASQLSVRGVFVLAPAFFMPGYEQYTPQPPVGCPVTIVHGWNDTVVPPENSVRYAREHRATLHLIDSDHRLTANIDEVCEFLDRFLRRL
ncbi:MAG TPA: alpha/beta fold hydrolase [Steroidobacteraceae bacterium]|nr:alpha/beta fold hydrolase [Steroidobacteraceae bacterium]